MVVHVRFHVREHRCRWAGYTSKCPFKILELARGARGANFSALEGDHFQDFRLLCRCMHAKRCEAGHISGFCPRNGLGLCGVRHGAGTLIKQRIRDRPEQKPDPKGRGGGRTGQTSAIHQRGLRSPFAPWQPIPAAPVVDAAQDMHAVHSRLLRRRSDGCGFLRGHVRFRYCAPGSGDPLHSAPRPSVGTPR
mgnify:CR=1 FL=1